MNDQSNEQNPFEWLSHQCLKYLSGIALLFMVVLIVLGMLTMGLGIFRMCKYFVLSIASFGAGSGEVPVAFALAAALDGLEFVFLAPLAYLLLHGIWDFMNDARRGHFRDPNKMPASPLFLVRIKALIIGLMIAVVATELLKKTVSERGLSYESAIAGALLIAVMALYSFIIEGRPEKKAAPFVDNRL